MMGTTDIIIYIFNYNWIAATPSRGIKMSSAIPLSWTIQEMLMFLLSLLPHLGVSNVGRNELKQRLMGSNPSQFVDVVPCTY